MIANIGACIQAESRSLSNILKAAVGFYAGVFVIMMGRWSLLLLAVAVLHARLYRCLSLLVSVAAVMIVSRKAYWTLPQLESGIFFLTIDVLAFVGSKPIVDALVRIGNTIEVDAIDPYFHRAFLSGAHLMTLWSIGLLSESCCGESAEHIVGDDDLMCHSKDVFLICQVLPSVGLFLIILTAVIHIWRDLRPDDPDKRKQSRFWRLGCLAYQLMIVFIGCLLAVASVIVVMPLFYVMYTIGMGFLAAYISFYTPILVGIYLSLLVGQLAVPLKWLSFLVWTLLLAVVAFLGSFLFFRSWHIMPSGGVFWAPTLLMSGLVIGMAWNRCEHADQLRAQT